MKIFFTMLLLLSLVFSLSACNYKAIDDALHDKVNETAEKLQNNESVPSGMDVIEDSSTGTTAYIPSDATKDKIEIKDIGESFPSRIPYLDGVEYTLKGYTYYESFADSGISREELSISDDEYYDDVISRCGFYLIDMSVNYNGSGEYPEEFGDYPIYCDLIPAETDRDESVNNASADELLQVPATQRMFTKAHTLRLTTRKLQGVIGICPLWNREKPWNFKSAFCAPKTTCEITAFTCASVKTIL